MMLASLLCAVAAETVHDKPPKVTIQIPPSTNDQGRRDGAYTEYYRNGKIKRQALFLRGKLEGPYVENIEDGQKCWTAEFHAGKLHGLLTRYEKGQSVLTLPFKEGVPVFARSMEQIKQKLAALNPGPTPESDPANADRQAALRQLQSYRYLAGVPCDNVVLNDAMNRSAQAACEICVKLGRMDHTPPNPGLPEAEYKLAYKGATSSNLAVGYRTMAKAIEGWIDDSDPRNIVHLGHRRWCLHPWLRQVGFGKAGNFQAMWAFDASQKKIAAFQFVSFPAAGFMPVEYFRPSYAWSVTLNPRKYRKPAKTVQPKVYVVDQFLNKVGEPLKLNSRTVDTKAYGIANCIIFRPEGAVVATGRRYLVEIDGIQRKKGKPETLRYVVQFVSLK
jgi:hypothetical protein